MTRQPDLFLPMCARTMGRQATLFDTDGPPAQTARCKQCQDFLELTPSGYLCCPNGHGKLLCATDGDTEPQDDWPEQARRIAKRHAARDNWLGSRWRCECGACSRARLDGFIPRQRIDR